MSKPNKLPKLISKVVIFTFENHTITYNGVNIIVVDRATNNIVARDSSTYVTSDPVEAQTKLAEMLEPVLA